MSEDFKNLWGQSYEDYSDSLELGINKKVFLHDIKFEEGQYGPQLYVEFHKGTRAVKQWFSIPNYEEVQSGRITNDRYKDLVTRFNSILKHIVCNFVTEDQYQAHIKTYNSAKEFVIDMLTLIPANFQELEGELILIYNKKGYLSLPISMKITGPFFSVGGRYTLKPSGLVMDSKPKEASSDGLTTPTPSPSDDLPF